MFMTFVIIYLFIGVIWSFVFAGSILTKFLKEQKKCINSESEIEFSSDSERLVFFILMFINLIFNIIFWPWAVCKNLCHLK